jgi:hypothetical protein
MTGELPLWAARIREERAKRLWSQKLTAVRLRDAADEYTRARLPSIENIKRRVRGHESGQNHPGDLYIELYCRAFGLTREALFGSSPAPRQGGERLFPTGQDRSMARHPYDPAGGSAILCAVCRSSPARLRAEPGYPGKSAAGQPGGQRLGLARRRGSCPKGAAGCPGCCLKSAGRRLQAIHVVMPGSASGALCIVGGDPPAPPG